MGQQLLLYIAVVTMVAALISAGCDVRSVLRERDMASRGSPRPRRYFTGAVLWALVAVAAVGVDIYDRHHQQINWLLISDFGIIQPGNRVYAVVGTRPLTAMAKDRYIMLALLIEDNQMDFWQDRRLEKSKRFSISGNLVQIEMVPSAPFILRIEKGQMVNYFLLLMPQNVEEDQVLSLSQVQQLGGKVLNRVAEFWPQQALDQPTAPTAP